MPSGKVVPSQMNGVKPLLSLYPSKERITKIPPSTGPQHLPVVYANKLKIWQIKDYSGILKLKRNCRDTTVVLENPDPHLII